MEHKGTKDQRTKPVSDQGRRRPYRRPKLTEYGSLRDITEGTAFVELDAGGGTSKF